MVRSIAISRTRLVSEPQLPPTRRRVTMPQKSEALSSDLTFRRVGPTDLPWVQAWTTKLGLPTPRSGRVRSFILLENERRIGYLAGRPSLLNLGNGREPVMWIVGAYLIPSKRGKGLIPKFAEMLSPQEYPVGKLAARVAIDNTRMHRFMTSGRWKKLRKTRRFVEYVLELKAPYQSHRKRYLQPWPSQYP